MSNVGAAASFDGLYTLSLHVHVVVSGIVTVQSELLLRAMFVRRVLRSVVCHGSRGQMQCQGRLWRCAARSEGGWRPRGVGAVVHAHQIYSSPPQWSIIRGRATRVWSYCLPVASPDWATRSYTMRITAAATWHCERQLSACVEICGCWLPARVRSIRR